jgi:hypothetical protein
LAIAAQNKINGQPAYIAHRPYFKMTMSSPVDFPISSLLAGGKVPFDTINVDTVGTICDLTRASSGAFLTSGIWVCGSYLLVAPTGSTAANYAQVFNTTSQVSGSSLIKTGPANIVVQTYDGGANSLQTFVNSSFIIYSGPQTALTTAPTISSGFTVSYAAGSANTVATLSYATLWGYWVSDL